MRLAMLGGGGFRTPLVYGALLRDRHEGRVREVCLHDVDAARLAAMAGVLADQARGHDDPPTVRTSTDLDAALAGADFVFSAIRVGGLEGRIADERVALDLGLLGQETTGPGGLAYGLRTVPVARRIAERVRAVAPEAWVINFTNPAGMITEAMQAVLGDRVVGICDSPIGLARRVGALFGVDEADLEIDYAGLNHLGWLQGLRAGDRDLLGALLAADDLLAELEETDLFGADWLRALRAVPNEYLYYYYFTRDAVAAIRGAAHTRGEFLLEQQRRCYETMAARRDGAFAEWERVRRERNATYMREARGGDDERAEASVEGGGYEGVALAIMAAISRGVATRLVLDVRGRGVLPGLPDDAVVEVPCTVDGAGPRPLPVTALSGHRLGLAQQVKEVEQLVIEAAITGSPDLAVQAFAVHPLVDSVSVARQLLAGYRRRIPQVDAVFTR